MRLSWSEQQSRIAAAFGLSNKWYCEVEQTHFDYAIWHTDTQLPFLKVYLWDDRVCAMAWMGGKFSNYWEVGEMSDPLGPEAGFSHVDPHDEFETPFLRAIFLLKLEESLPPEIVISAHQRLEWSLQERELENPPL